MSERNQRCQSGSLLPWRVLLFVAVVSAWSSMMVSLPASSARAQQSADDAQTDQPGPAPAGEVLTPEAAAEKARQALAKPEPGEADSADAQQTPDLSVDTPKINLLDLMIRGGWLMLPILAMSMLVVTFGVERGLGLRRHKVLPPELVEGLGGLASQKGGLEPRAAYRLCQQYPSSAANVIKAMLLKVGRPHSELEHAVVDASDREAARLYSNVRWLSLAAGVSPLLGLLGTVWGMIQAFFVTASLPTGANKAEYLANGIYVALVTTFAGLAVAIPAAVLAHLFEGRIQALFRELDETLLGLMPQLERFEGRLRVSQEMVEDDGQAPPRRPAATAPK